MPPESLGSHLAVDRARAQEARDRANQTRWLHCIRDFLEDLERKQERIDRPRSFHTAIEDAALLIEIKSEETAREIRDVVLSSKDEEEASRRVQQYLLSLSTLIRSLGKCA